MTRTNLFFFGKSPKKVSYYKPKNDKSLEGVKIMRNFAA